jgi:hypothetical protein
MSWAKSQRYAGDSVTFRGGEPNDVRCCDCGLVPHDHGEPDCDDSLRCERSRHGWVTQRQALASRGRNDQECEEMSCCPETNKRVIQLEARIEAIRQAIEDYDDRHDLGASQSARRLRGFIDHQLEALTDGNLVRGGDRVSDELIARLRAAADDVSKATPALSALAHGIKLVDWSPDIREAADRIEQLEAVISADRTLANDSREFGHDDCAWESCANADAATRGGCS